MSRLLQLLALSLLPLCTRAQAGWGWEAQCIGLWLQCGGRDYWGPTNCCAGTDCEYVNEWWWQCNPAPTPAEPPAPEEPAVPETLHPTPAPPRPTPKPTTGTLPPAPAPAPAPAAPVPHPTHPKPTPTPPPATTAATPAPEPVVPAAVVPAAATGPTPTPAPPAASIDPDTGAPFWDRECFKVRRNVLSLSDKEMSDFIEGLHELKANGEYDRITAMHGDPTTFNDFHGNDYFLPWHRWYILLIEDAVRKLGGKWSCFAMPYWDWTLDAGKEDESPVWDIFGPLGHKDQSFCMRDGPFGDWTNDEGGCLKRIGASSFRFFTPAEMMNLIMSEPKYVNGFRPQFEAGAHARPHLYIGGAMNSFASPDDPIFWLHHTFVDKVWAMWQDCHGHTDPRQLHYPQFKSAMADVQLTWAPEGISTRSMWNMRDLDYTFEQDLFSATTFVNTCTFASLKPNPTLEAARVEPPAHPAAVDPTSASPLPVDPNNANIETASLPAETTTSTSTDPNAAFPGDLGAPLPGLDPNAPTPADQTSTATDPNAAFGGVPVPVPVDVSTGGVEVPPAAAVSSSTTEIVEVAPVAVPPPPPMGNLRGSNVPRTEEVGQASQAAAATAAGPGFPNPWNLAKLETFNPLLLQQMDPELVSRQVHGLEIIERENRFFQACLRNAVSEGQSQGYHLDCTNKVVEHDCSNLGAICDLPNKWLQSMNLVEAQAILKSSNPCVQACAGVDHSQDLEGGGMGM